ncbi:MAG: hypothetical protein V1813_00855 [Candidatus Aenigmatarchaeota archaeon]
MMKINRGFVSMETPGGADDIVWVVPHSGPALETPTSRDDNADTVASLCWMKTGGKLLISTLPRKRALGIDFNRDPPPAGKAMKYYEMFQNNADPEAMQQYREMYAWVAGDRADHVARLKIYNDFWDEIRNAGSTVVFVHRKFTRMKNFPSIMDVISYRNFGSSKGLLSKTVGEANRKYSGLLASLARPYKKAIMLEQQRVVQRIVDVFGKLDLDKMDAEYRKNILDDIRVIKKYADPEIARKLERRLTPSLMMKGVKSALRNSGPEITIESIFSGDKALSQVRSICREKNVLCIESNAFINYWYPNETSSMIIDVINEIKSVRKITSYLTEKQARRELECGLAAAAEKQDETNLTALAQ